MSAIKFHHVFAALLLISALTAFVIPARYTVQAQPQVQGLFQPVAKPVRGVARWVDERVIQSAPRDARDAATLASENDELRQKVAWLSHALEAFKTKEAAWAQLGEIRHLCTEVSVVGPVLGGRDGLTLRGSSFDGLRRGQFVLFSGGIAGMIDKPTGMLGAQVALVTDPSMKVEGYFAGFGPKGHEPRQTEAALFEGMGQGMMICRGLTMQQVRDAGVKVDDGVFVQDRDWDERLHGMRLGKVIRIAEQPGASLFAEILVRPTSNLLRLRDVLVLTK